jgi:hypothetical protein
MASAPSRPARRAHHRRRTINLGQDRARPRSCNKYRIYRKRRGLPVPFAGKIASEHPTFGM